MSTKHTPGPWEIRQSYSAERLIVQAPQPTNRVLAGFGSEDEPLDDTDVANARLIAAAPELLEALEALDDVYRDAQMNAPENRAYAPDAFDEAWTQARAAISKATGEQQ